MDIINNNKYNDKSNKNNIIDIKNINIVNNSEKKCIGPCYPPEYLNYHPYYLFPVKHKSKTCPTETGTLKCDKITPNYKEYNIFKTTGYVGTDPDFFILELYDINDPKKIVIFLNHEFDKFPLITCKRILTTIFNKFSKNNDFPLYLFSTKFENIFKKYYKSNKKLDYFDNIKNIIFSNHHITDIFIFFYKKFL
jgi:hypothetical protein